MNKKLIIATAGIYLLTAAVTLAIITLLRFDNQTLSFIVGSVSGVFTHVYLLRKNSGENNLSAKLTCGTILAVSAVLFGLASQLLFSPFPYPEVTISIAPVGSFVFPFAIFNTFWKSLDKEKKVEQGA